MIEAVSVGRRCAEKCPESGQVRMTRNRVEASYRSPQAKVRPAVASSHVKAKPL
jgi:hypothetical protein